MVQPLAGRTAAEVDASSWSVPPLFEWLWQSGKVPAAEMYRTFNCGLGMLVVVAADQADHALKLLAAASWKQNINWDCLKIHIVMEVMNEQRMKFFPWLTGLKPGKLQLKVLYY